MAWYNVTYKCGHEGQVQLYGKTKDRERKLEWMSNNVLCDDCQKTEFARQNAAAANHNAAIGLPELSGSPKQIAWAESLRAKCYKALTADDAIVNILKMVVRHAKRLELTNEIIQASAYNTPETARKLMGDLITKLFASKTAASWWIDRRPQVRTNGDVYDWDDVTEELLQQFAEAIKASAARAAEPQTKKAQLARIMRRAWQIARAAAAKIGCVLKDVIFGECLKQAWAEARA